MQFNINPFGNCFNRREDFSDCVAQYKRYREINQQFQSMLPKHLSKKALLTCGRRLGVMKKDTLVLDTEDEICVIMDHCLYDYYENGVNAVLRYKNEFPPAAGTDQEIVLNAMAASFYTIIQVEEIIPSVGILANDLLNGRQYLLIDLGLSHSAVKRTALATRIIPFYDFVMTSGAGLPINAAVFRKIMDYAENKLGDKNGSFAMNSPQMLEFRTYIIRSALNARMSEHITYEDIDSESVSGPVKQQSRTGRNDPCPCGSGLKYKRCCGK